MVIRKDGHFYSDNFFAARGNSARLLFFFRSLKLVGKGSEQVNTTPAVPAIRLPA
jgi:hypothetical protein